MSEEILTIREGELFLILVVSMWLDNNVQDSLLQMLAHTRLQKLLSSS